MTSTSTEQLESRLKRVAALLDVGVEMQSALCIELIRSLHAGHLDRTGLEYLFDSAEEASAGAQEVLTGRDLMREGDTRGAIARLQDYIQRTLVEEVPISERRLRRSKRFVRES